MPWPNSGRFSTVKTTVEDVTEINWENLENKEKIWERPELSTS